MEAELPCLPRQMANVMIKTSNHVTEAKVDVGYGSINKECGEA